MVHALKEILGANLASRGSVLFDPFASLVNGLKFASFFAFQKVMLTVKATLSTLAYFTWLFWN